MSWYERDPLRCALEMELLGRHHPGVQVVKQGGLLKIRMVVAGQFHQYHVEAVYPQRFPTEPVLAFVRSPPVHGAPHVFSNDQLCMYHDGEYGPQTTGKVYLDWVLEWIDRYEKLLRTHRWED